MSADNQQLVVVSHFVGVPKLSDFQLESIPTPSADDLKDDQYLAKLVWVSVDPYLRGGGPLKPHPLGAPVVSAAVVQVLASKNVSFPKGSHVVGYFPWKRIFIRTATTQDRKLDETVPVQTALGVLGRPGLTAYFGLFEIASLKEGDVVFVSGAAGAVGSLVGQYAKLRGHTVIGSAGGPDKCKHVVQDLGFHACIDYKKHTTVDAIKAQLQQFAPKGIDVYFDNTGGHVTDAIFDHLNKFARVAVCGQISMYNSTDAVPLAPLFLHKIIYKSVTIRGFVVGDFITKAMEFYKYTIPLVLKGEIKYHEHIVQGFEHIPDAFIGLFYGNNIGKAIVKI